MPQQEQWQLSGNAAELYERYVVPYFLGPWAPGLIEVAALQPGERVLDVACGTGVIARLAAQQVRPAGQVTGLDLNPGMLAVARALPPPPGAIITWVECSAVVMHLPDATFDVVLCQQGLQFFPDKPAALREMHRVLVLGGRVVLSVWTKTVDPYGLAQWEAVERHVSTEAATRLRAPRVVPEPEELSRLLNEAGFRDRHIRTSRMTQYLPALETLVLCHLAATPIADAVAALSDEARTALARDVRSALQAYADGDGVAVPNETNMVTAHT
jgi:ubiquinone/menaquinone biosynthesis C-methylase UbiE